VAYAGTLCFIQDVGTIFHGTNSSLRDVYEQNSFGQFSIQSTLTGWITVGTTEVLLTRLPILSGLGEQS
jgi:hypothetical protein